MKFNHPAEVLVYKALLCLQAELSPFRTIGIAANCRVRVVERTFEPDFLVTYAGRQLGIEVDGATHNRKLASDHSRQQLLTDAGIDILRIDIADAFDPDERCVLAAGEGKAAGLNARRRSDPGHP